MVPDRLDRATRKVDVIGKVTAVHPLGVAGQLLLRHAQVLRNRRVHLYVVEQAGIDRPLGSLHHQALARCGCKSR